MTPAVRFEDAGLADLVGETLVGLRGLGGRLLGIWTASGLGFVLGHRQVCCEHVLLGNSQRELDAIAGRTLTGVTRLPSRNTELRFDVGPSAALRWSCSFHCRHWPWLSRQQELTALSKLSLRRVRISEDAQPEDGCLERLARAEFGLPPNQQGGGAHTCDYPWTSRLRTTCAG